MNASNAAKIVPKPIADFSGFKDNVLVYGKVKKDGTIYFRKKDILDSLENFLFKDAAVKKYKNTMHAVEQSLKKMDFPESSRQLALTNIRSSTEASEKVSAGDLKRAAKIANQTQLSPLKNGIEFFNGSPLGLASEYKIVRASTLSSSHALTDNEKQKLKPFTTIQQRMLESAARVAKANNTQMDLETFPIEIPSVASAEVFTLVDLEKWSTVDGVQIKLDSRHMNDAIFSGLKATKGANGTCVVDIYPGELKAGDSKVLSPIFSEEHLRAMLDAAQKTIDTAKKAGQTLRIVFATENKELFKEIKGLKENE